MDRPAAGAEAAEGEARAAEQLKRDELRRQMKLAAAVEDFARAAQLQVELRALESSAGSGEGGQGAAGCASAARSTSATAKPATAKPAAARPAAARPAAARPAAATKPKENRPLSSHQGN